MLLHASLVCSSLLFIGIPLFKYVKLCSSILLLIGTWASPSWVLLCLKLLKTFCKHTFPLLVDKCLRVKFVSHRVGVCVNFILKTAKTFPKAVVSLFHLHQQCMIVQLFHTLTKIGGKLQF